MQRILIGMLLAGVVTTGCTADRPAGQATRTSERRTVASPTSRPPVQARNRRRTQVACSQADLGNPGTARMPRPSRVSTTRVVNQVTLGPPLATDRPTISPAQAWDNPQIGKPVAGTYELLLTRLSAPLPATPGADGHLVPKYQNIFVWVVIAHHVPVAPIGPGPPAPGATTVPRPPCFFEDAMTWVDARTGQLLIGSTFPATTEAST